MQKRSSIQEAVSIVSPTIDQCNLEIQGILYDLETAHDRTGEMREGRDRAAPLPQKGAIAQNYLLKF